MASTYGKRSVHSRSCWGGAVYHVGGDAAAGGGRWETRSCIGRNPDPLPSKGQLSRVGAYMESAHPAGPKPCSCSLTLYLRQLNSSLPQFPPRNGVG